MRFLQHQKIERSSILNQKKDLKNLLFGSLKEIYKSSKMICLVL